MALLLPLFRVVFFGKRALAGRLVCLPANDSSELDCETCNALPYTVQYSTLTSTCKIMAE